MIGPILRKGILPYKWINLELQRHVLSLCLDDEAITIHIAWKVQATAQWAVTEGRSVYTWRENMHQAALKAPEEILDNKAVPFPSHQNK